jgi:hypothetical protein
MRYVDVPPAEISAYVALLARWAAELDALGRRLDAARLPAPLHGPCARGLYQAIDAMCAELRAISTEVQSRTYAVRPVGSP